MRSTDARFSQNMWKAKKKSIDEIAREVIAGDWGNGEDRKNRLKKSGYEYDKVQKRVNELLGK